MRDPASYKRNKWISQRISQWGFLAILTLVAHGCGGDTTAPPSLPKDILWTVAWNHRAVTISTQAPYNTVQLIPTPLNADGVPITENVTVRYSYTDPAISVDSTGFVTGVSAKTGIIVRTAVTVKNITVRDSVIINVNNVAPPPAFATFSMAPTAVNGQLITDCSVNDLLGLRKPKLVPRVWDQSNTQIANVLVVYTSADPAIATVARASNNTGTVTTYGCRKEIVTVKLYAEATVYGVTKRDSVLLVVRPPKVAGVRVRSGTLSSGGPPISFFEPETIVISAGGVVFWFNHSYQPVDVTFENPAAAEATIAPTPTVFLRASQIPVTGEAGNIESIPPDTACKPATCTTDPSHASFIRARRFQQPGTYTYRSNLYGTTGKIVVKDTVLTE